MTGLMAASLLGIIAGGVTLVLGWTTTDQTLLLISIGSEVLAVVLMSLAYHRSRNP
jgi:hypothetical protein